MTLEEMDSLAKAMGGLHILGCMPGSPAALVGVRYGDILLEVNGIPTPTLEAYIEIMAAKPKHMTVRVFRGGQELSFELDLSQRSKVRDPMAVLRALAETGVMKVLSGGGAETLAPARAVTEWKS